MRTVLRAAALSLTLLALGSVSAAAQGSSLTLELEEVLESVEQHYPILVAAQLEREIAAGQLQQARGGFDTMLNAEGITAPRGFYQNDRADLSLEQSLSPWGIEILGGYRLGVGDFADYDKDLLTNEDGELRLGARVPLLRNRAIDERRAGLRKAKLGVEGAEPTVLEQRIQVRRLAELAYWEWLSAGEKDRIALSLIQLASDRQESLRGTAEEGLIAEIVLVDNERLLAERRAIRIGTERRLQQAAIELSLYLRDPSGRPMIPGPERLPASFPSLSDPGVDVEADIELARSVRPELQRLQIEREARSVEIERTRNATLPGLDFSVAASQDYGEPVSVPDDKSEFELKAGLFMKVPLQRRGARGKLRAQEAKLGQFDQKIRLVGDEIAAEVRDAHSAWLQAWRRYEQAARSLDLARELEEAEGIQVTEGNSDLLRLNIREQQTAQAASFLVDVMTEYWEARAKYIAAIGEIPTS